MALDRTGKLERAETIGDVPPAPSAATDDGTAASQGSRIDSIREHVQTPLFRNAYALIVNTGVTALLGFAYWVLAARLYSTSDVGLAAAAISAMTLLAGISHFNLEAVMVRFLPIAAGNTRRLAGTVYIGCMVAAAILATLFVLGLDIWEPTLGFLTEHAAGAWFVAATVVWMFFILQDGILVGLGRAVWVPIENAIFGAIKLVLLVLFVGFGPFGIFESWAVAAALVVVPFTALIFLRFIPQHMAVPIANAPRLTAEMVRRYAMGDYVGSVFDLAAISLLPLLVTHWAGPEENAFFYQGWTIAYTLILVANNTSRALTVEAAKEHAQLRSYGRVVFMHTLKLLAPAVVAMVILAPLLLSVFGSEYAAGGTLALRILALAAIPHTVVLLALVTARLQHRMWEVVAIQSATAIIVLGTSLALVGDHGGTGAAIGWLVGQTLVALALLATRLQWLYRSGDAASGERA